jgi:streptogramin lyase
MMRRSLGVLVGFVLALGAGLPGGLAAHASRAAAPSITEFPLPTAGAQPNGIVAGPDGNLWFAEQAADQIGRMDLAGNVTEFPLAPGSEPTAITVGPDGNLWFTEFSRDRIGRITIAGVIKEFRVPPGSKPLSIAAGTDGNIWFTETGANRVARMTTMGTEQSAFNIPLPQQQPRIIIPGPDGNMWFTEPPSAQGGLHGLIRITPAGVMKFFNLSLGLPYGLAVSADGADIWVTDQGTPEVSRFTIATHHEDVIPIPGSTSWPDQATTATDGSIMFTEPGIGEDALGGNKIGHINPATGKVVQLKLPFPNSWPLGITVGPDGATWFTEQLGNKIARINM